MSWIVFGFNFRLFFCKFSKIVLSKSCSRHRNNNNNWCFCVNSFKCTTHMAGQRASVTYIYVHLSNIHDMLFIQFSHSKVFNWFSMHKVGPIVHHTDSWQRKNISIKTFHNTQIRERCEWQRKIEKNRKLIWNPSEGLIDDWLINKIGWY